MAPFLDNDTSTLPSEKWPQSIIDAHPVSPSNIKVLIIGAGFAGLTAAIECKRKGHDPLILESFSSLKQLGDIISFGSNAGRIFRRWPGVEQQLDPICHTSDRLKYFDWQGDFIYEQIWGNEEENFGKRFNGHRGQIHGVLYQHALDLGIEVRLGQKVTEYWQDENVAGVIVNGETVTADVVLAADGVRSKARKAVLGYEDAPKSSGYAIYRAWLDSDELAKNPLTAHLVNNGDTHTGWLGPDIHFLAASIKDGKEFSWVCTHKVCVFERRTAPFLTLSRMMQMSRSRGLRLAIMKMRARYSKAGTLLSMRLFG